MKSFLKISALLILILFVVMIVRALSVESKQSAIEPIAKLAIDESASIERLRKAIQQQTISYDDASLMDVSTFQALHQHLETSFPLVHTNLEREVINEMSLVFKWQGSDSSLKPIAMLNHIDVVPVQDINLSKWTAPPFAADIVDGWLYGRGTLDTKSGAMATLEAAELLLKDGFQPKQDIYIILGHDEEIGGDSGNQAIVKMFKNNGIHFDFVMDEGGAIIKGAIPGIENSIAMVGVTEKGYVTLHLNIETEAGHSSTPPSETAIGIMSAALTKIESHPFPSRLVEPVALNFSYLAGELSFPYAFVLANLWFFEPALIAGMKTQRSLAAMTHTTTAITIINSGVKENVLPSLAKATVNFRILPGENTESVKQRIVDLIDDDRISVSYGEHFGYNPTSVSDPEAQGFKVIQKTAGQVFNSDDEQIYTVPFMLMGGTDSRHYEEITDNTFRFNPMHLQLGDTKKFHGIDERIRVDNYLDMIRFFHQFLLNLQDPV